MLLKGFEEQVRLGGHRVAIKTEKEFLTYRELNRYAGYIAGIITQKWPAAGKHTQKKIQSVGLLLPHGTAMIAAILGSLKAGKVYVPLSVDYPENRLAYMLSHSEASLILTVSRHRDVAAKLAADNGIDFIEINKIPAASPVLESQRQTRVDELAYIMYTSGSTGKPKGVMQTHGNATYYVRNWIQRFSISHTDRMTLFSSFCHDGSVQDMFAALHSGAVLYPYNFRSREENVGLAEFLIREGITIWHSVPSLYTYFASTLSSQTETFPQLRFILLGGEPVREHEIAMLNKFFPHSILANVYGQTESSVNSIHLISPGDTFHKTMIGEPLDKTRIFVVNEDGRPVQPYESGEILVACEHISPGYWKNPEADDEVFSKDETFGQLYWTGDLGRLLPDNRIEFLGRRDFQVKIRGFRVEMGEIETLLLKHDHVKEAVVSITNVVKGENRLCAYVVPAASNTGKNDTSTVSLPELKTFLMGELPDYMIPTYFVQLEKMPLTPSGKVDRKALPEPEQVRPHLEVSYARPQNQMEKNISTVWQEVLHLDKVGIHDNFFDLGGTSLHILEVMKRLHEVFKKNIPLVSLFRYPTIHLLAGYLAGETSGNQELAGKKTRSGQASESLVPIAIIGMACRFPGAANIEQYWENLKAGKESITFFSDRELESEGVNPRLLANPDYVKAKGLLENVEYFDSVFFEYSHAEAEMMDPQLRLLHECSWEALENAGYHADSFAGRIGLYAGNSPNYGWVGLTYLNRTSMLDTVFLNNNYSTKVSYKLNLQGPSFIVQTACSTSLTALHLACRGLLDHECDMVLAGGVSVSLPPKSGYLYQEEMIYSKDGHCRVFDANAGGTVFGDGVGMVVLKMLPQALADGDTIHAVIKATAVNNDGKRKVGITAPSVAGQAEVIRDAHCLAGIEPESIGYVETHGTGTLLGDPVEMEALKLAFNTNKKGYCAIGSVKSNIGHLNAAAGAAGLIKTVLALEHGLIPPSLNFEASNPQIDFQDSPFYVNTRLLTWKKNQSPLRAGVSSFGIGGTNAHILLEEWHPVNESANQRVSKAGDTRPQTGENGRQYHLILLSAKTRTALDKMTLNLSGYFKKNPGINLGDAAYSLQAGRKVFSYRKMLVCSTIGEAVAGLSSPGSHRVRTVRSKSENPAVIFMFSGLGGQYVNMGWELYRTEPCFREEMDRCFEILNSLLDNDIKEILYPSSVPQNPLSMPNAISRTEIAQLVVFIFEYALARLLISWGITPRAVIGYSFGEYAAACISGVFSLGDALKLVTIRGQLIRELPPGAMLNVPLSREQLDPLLPGELCLALDNGSSCVVSGPTDSIAAFIKQMKEKKLMCMPLSLEHALHSRMMAPIKAELEKAAAQLTLNPAQIPYISSVTGEWLTNEEAVDPGYWGTHLEGTVQFIRGLSCLPDEEKGEDVLFVEIGPGRDLTALVKGRLQQNRPGQTHGNQAGEKSLDRVFNLVRHPSQEVSDVYFLLNRIGNIWLYGQSIDWNGYYYLQEQCRRIPLPTYPFEGQRCWPDKTGGVWQKSPSRQIESHDLADWFYVPTWTCQPLLSQVRPPSPTDTGSTSNYLVFLEKQCRIGTLLVDRLRQLRHEVIIVKPGSKFSRSHTGNYIINPRKKNDYQRLFRELASQGTIPGQILHLWGVTGNCSDEAFERIQELGFYSLVNTAKAIGSEKFASSRSFRITVLTDHLHEITGEELLNPAKATVIGPLKVIPQENPGIQCRSIDIVPPEPGSIQEERFIRQLLEEISSGGIDNNTMIAFRRNLRWVQTFVPLHLDNTRETKPPFTFRLREKGVYLVSGGTGKIGLILAEYLAEHVKARLVLTGRSSFPGRDQWDDWLARHGEQDAVSRKIRRVKKMEAAGAEVRIFSADLANLTRMQEVIAHVEQEWGSIAGVIHAAGITRGNTFNSIRELKTSECTEQFQAKIQGLFVLDSLMRDKDVDFFWLISSLSAVLGGLGFTAYAAANSFMDAFARKQNRCCSTLEKKWITIDWEGENAEEVRFGFQRILSLGKVEQVVFSRGGRLQERVQQWINLENRNSSAIVPSPRQSRPDLLNPYIPPQNRLEHTLVEIWQTLFKFEPLGVHDDFIELGGDSLKAINMMNRVHKELHTTVPLKEFFNKPTIAALAEYIAGAEKDTYQSVPASEKKEYYLLSPAQKRLFILHRINPNSIGYNLASAMILAGKIDAAAMEKSFLALISRHESLRTSFHMIGNEPVQRVHQPGEMEFAIKYHEQGAKEDSQSVNQKIKQFIHPFDLTNAPLLRVLLITLKKEKWILAVDMHHIIRDGISQTLFWQDFAAFYRGEVLAGLTVQYKDYAEWQHRTRQEESFKKQEQYWISRFKTGVPVLDLPLDYARPVMQNFEGARLRFTLDNETTAALKTLAGSEETTLFMILLAVFNVFLTKLSGQEDIVVGIPESTRGHEDLQKIIGIFLNTLALRSSPAGYKSFKVLLEEIKTIALEAFENCDYPFEELVERTIVNRDLSRNPLFDVMFVLHTQWTPEPVETPPGNISGLDVKSYPYQKNTSEYDLTLIGRDQGDHLSFRFEYCTRLFKPQTLERFRSYFQEIVSAVVRHPDQKLREIDVISQEEKIRVLWEFNNTGQEYDRDKSLQELFTRQAAGRPDSVAITGKELGAQDTGYLTYDELNKKSLQLAHLLRRNRVTTGAIVGIMVERSIEMIIAILGVLKSGGAYLPIDPQYPAERIKYMLADSNSGTLITHHTCVKSEEINFSKTTIYLETDLWKGKNVVSTPSPSPGTDRVHFQPTYVLYTSGSTGKPKGVVIRHQQVGNLIKGITSIIDYSPGKRILAITTICFDIFFLETLLPLVRGLNMVIADEVHQRDPHWLGKIITQHQVNMVQFTPSRLKLFAEIDMRLTCLKGVSELIVCGEAFPVSLFEAVRGKFPGIIYNGYGPTEATVFSLVKNLSHTNSRELTIGTPIANTQAYIVDRNSRLQPVGVPGELLIGGDGVAAGYLNNPGLTAEKFIELEVNIKSKVEAGEAPWEQIPNKHMSHMNKIYKTGDLARWLSYGEVEFLGRIDFQVKIRGFRIELNEIEHVLQGREDISEAVVTAKTSDKGDQYLTAYWVAAQTGGNSINGEGLREFLSQQLPDYMIPSYFVQLEKMPLTLNNKIDRKSLPDPGQARPQLETAYLEPGTEMEKMVAGLWEEELGVEAIGVNDNFFHLGGHSLNAIKVIHRLSLEFHKNIPVVSLFKYRTVKIFALYLSGEEGVGLSIADRSGELLRGEKDKQKIFAMRKGGIQ